MLFQRTFLAVALLAVACGQASDELGLDDPSEPPPTPDVRSTYLDVFLGAEGRICPPTLERLDAEVERLAEALGVPLDAEQRITLHYSDEAVKDRCNIELEVGEFLLAGCTHPDGDWIAAQPGVESHELVHALRVREGLVGPPYWEEGLATYHGTLRPYGAHRVSAGGVRQPSQSLRSSAVPDQVGYDESAHFIAFLDRTYGADQVRTLSRWLGEGVEPGVAFEQLLDASPEAVEERWKIEADPAYELGPLCEADVVVGAEPVVLRGEIGCDVPGVIGPGPPRSADVFRGPRHCLHTPPATTLTVIARSSNDDGVVEVGSVASDACPAHDTSDTNVVAGRQLDFETRGCTWSVAYASTIEGDAYEIELVVR